MAAPSYTHDLTTIATGDEAAGWTTFSTNQQGTPSYQDADYPYIQGSYAVTQTCSKSKTLANLGYDNGSTITLPVDGAFLVWQLFASPFAIDDYIGTSTTYGGMHVLIGQNISNFGWWDVGGSDKTPNPYGGFQCHAVNTTVSFDRQTGTRTADQVVGAGVALTAFPSKGEPHAVDVIRWGRCSAIFAGGDTSTPATFSGFATRNDAQGNRWGLLQETAGGYLWQGHMQIGDTPAASACRFEDSNVTVFVKWCPKTTRRFNKIEVINSSSYIDWEGVSFQVLDLTTNSRGWFKMTDPATLYWNSCSFNDMDKFIFNYSSNPVEITLSSFTRCGTISQGGSTFDGCTISNATSAIALSADNLETITNCDFISDGVGHAIELTVSGDGDLILDGNTFTEYASANGSTGNEAIYNNSGGNVTINLQNTASIPSIRNGVGSNTSVVLSVSLTLTGIVSGSEVRIQEARGAAPSGAELFHVETTDGTDVVWAYNFSDFGEGYFIDIIVHHVEYTHLRIDDVELPSTNTAIPIQQESDRWYLNPTIIKTETFGLRPTDTWQVWQDSKMVGGSPTTNYGTDVSIAAETVTNIILGPKIGVGIIPDFSTINSAKLWYYVHTLNASDAQDLWLLKRDWVESEVTWNIWSTGNSWQSGGGIGANDIYSPKTVTVTVNSTGWWSYDVTSDIQDWVDGVVPDLYGWIGIIGISAGHEFWSSNYTIDTSLRPYLSVTWTQ